MSTCRHCGVQVMRDDQASFWERRDVWFDPNVVDYDNPATHCGDDDVPHAVVSVS